MHSLVTLALVGFLVTCGAPPPLLREPTTDAGSQLTSANLVPNADFEARPTSDGPPDLWRVGPITEGGATYAAWGEDVEVSNDSSTGQVSVKLHGGATGGVPVSVLRSELFAITEDSCYALEVHFKGNAGGGSSLVALQMYDSGHSYTGQAVAFSVEHTATTWTREKRDGRAWGDGTRYGQVVLYGSVTTGSDVTIDSVEVVSLQSCAK